jgi:methionyl aminopeptidase
MRILIKTKAEIEDMKEGGQILGLILDELRARIVPGMTTRDIEEKANKLFQRFHVKPSFLGYKGFPSSICVSINDEVVHGIPNANKFLREGDIVSVDAGVFHKNLHTDSAIAIGVGKISSEMKKFLTAGEEALYKAISIIRPGIKLSEVSEIIESSLEQYGYSPVHDLTGHGVGRFLHEDPMVLNYVDPHMEDVTLKEGMTLAIEPIYTNGSNKIKVKSDKWTIVTRDGSMSSQVEHTLAVVANGCEIITKRPEMDPIYYKI